MLYVWTATITGGVWSDNPSHAHQQYHCRGGGYKTKDLCLLCTWNAWWLNSWVLQHWEAPPIRRKRLLPIVHRCTCYTCHPGILFFFWTRSELIKHSTFLESKLADSVPSSQMHGHFTQQRGHNITIFCSFIQIYDIKWDLHNILI